MGGVRLKLDVRGQGAGRSLDIHEEGGVGVPENLTIFIDVIFV